MAIRDLNKPDLWFTGDGDFLIDAAGDLRDTSDSGNVYEGIRQQIVHRIVCNKRGWRYHDDVSAGLERFIGKSITDELLERIDYAIRSAVMSDGHITSADMTLNILEITPGDIAVQFYLNVPDQEMPLLTMAYSIQYGSVIRIR